MDTLADTCCNVTNWKLVLFSNEVCEVSPFQDLYHPLKDIPVACVSPVWMDPIIPREYLIVGDQFLRFGRMINYFLINPYQIRVLNISVHDNTFDATVFGIEVDEAFTPFTSKVTVISFEL